MTTKSYGTVSEAKRKEEPDGEFLSISHAVCLMLPGLEARPTPTMAAHDSGVVGRPCRYPQYYRQVELLA